MDQTHPPLAAAPFVEEVELQGHILDSLLLPKVLDEILTRGGSYEMKDIRIGQRQTGAVAHRHAGGARRRQHRHAALCHVGRHLQLSAVANGEGNVEGMKGRARFESRTVPTLQRERSGSRVPRRNT